MNDSNSDRHAFRAAWHDYNCGIYFVTICCHEKRHLFGKISEGSMHLSAIGSIAQDCIKMIPQHNTSAEVWNHIVMPNHIHMVISVQTPETSRPSHSLGCLKPPRHGEECENYHHDSILAVVIGTFKAAVTRLVRARCIAPLPIIWQRSFHEHIIRDRKAFEKIMYYIDNNVSRWADDCFNKR